MKRKAAEKRERSILKGALAGLVGGIAGAGAKAAAGKVFAPGTDESIAPRPFHWAFGAVAGVVYGVAVETEPKSAAWRGAAFGLALKKLAGRQAAAVPSSFGVTLRQQTREKQSQWLGYAVYGIATEVVRRFVRRGL